MNENKEKFNLKNKETAVLIALLAVCVATLGTLVFLNIDRFTQTTTTTTTQKTPDEYVVLPELEGKTLAEARQILEELGLSFEIKATDSRRANVVEEADAEGERTADGLKIKRDTAVALHANEIGIDRVIYLTFDDGPTQDNTFDILDMLDERGICASFFVVGNRISLYGDRISAIVERGNVLACHSYSHELSEIYGKDGLDKLLSEIDAYERDVEKVLGKGAMNSVGRLFRFPGGSTQNNILTRAEALEYIGAIREKGYKIYDWTALTGDRDTPANTEPEDMLDELEATLARAKNRGEPLIVLLHDMQTTREALPEILDRLISEGYYFDTVNHCPEYTFAEN